MDEVRDILQTIAQSTLATTSVAEAVRKAVEDKRSSTTEWSKLIAKPSIFHYKSQDEEVKALKEWPWVFEKCLMAVDDGDVKDLKEIREKPTESFDWDLATSEEKIRSIKLYGLLASLMRGRALQLMKAVGDTHGFDAWRSLSKALKPTSKARGLAFLGAATAWPACSMNSALQPQLVKLEVVFDETVKAGKTIQEELESAALLRCVGGQLKSYLNLTIGNNVQYSTFEGTSVAMGSLSAEEVAVQTIKGLCQWRLVEFKMPKEKLRRARKERTRRSEREGS